MYRKKVEEAMNLITFSDLFLLPGRTEVNPEDISLNSNLTPKISLYNPMVSSPMDTVTGSKMASDIANLGGIGIIHRNCSIEEQVSMVLQAKQSEVSGENATVDSDGNLMVGAAIGPFDKERAKRLDALADVILVDLAHGHNMQAMKSVAGMMGREISVELIYGSIGSREAAYDIIHTIDNVAALRVGIGSGAICSTSVVTSASSPTLHSTIEVASELSKLGSEVPVIADGGIGNPGHAALCFAAGASSVMLGRLFAGTDSSPGRIIENEKQLMKEYRGMGSDEAKTVRYAMDRYSKPAKAIAEGISGWIPYVGSLKEMVEQFRGGLQAALGYAGAGDVVEMWQKARFGRISNQGIAETKPHDIQY